MKLTTAHKDKLIQLGLQKLLEGLNTPKKPRRKKNIKKQWSEARKRKFSKAMKAKWRALKKS